MALSDSPDTFLPWCSGHRRSLSGAFRLTGGIMYVTPLAQILPDYQSPSLELHCLPILVDLHQYPESWSISCLLLVPTRSKRGQFMRCGTFFAFHSAFGMSDWTGYQSVSSHKWLEYEAAESLSVYRISIVEGIFGKAPKIRFIECLQTS